MSSVMAQWSSVDEMEQCEGTMVDTESTVNKCDEKVELYEDKMKKCDGNMGEVSLYNRAG